METTIIIILGLLFMFEIAKFIGSKAGMKNLLAVLNEIKESMSQLAESKRLSTILTIEGNKEIDVFENFEPKREELRSNMLEILEEQIESRRKKSGRINDPDTAAFVILNHSGFDKFVSSEVRGKAVNALTRLIANRDFTSARRFITTLARNL